MVKWRMRKICEKKHLNRNGDNGEDDDCMWLAMNTTITIIFRWFITTILHDKDYGDDNDMNNYGDDDDEADDDADDAHFSLAHLFPNIQKIRF